MSTILKLLKLQIDNKTDILKTASPRKMTIAIAKALIVLLLITVVVALVLFKIFSLGILIGQEVIAIVLLFVQGYCKFRRIL